MSKSKVLVTGGAGFFGEFILDALQEQRPGYTLSVLDLRVPDTDTEARANVQYVQADITDRAAARRAIEKISPTAIIHTAGIVPQGNARYTRRNRERVFDINVNGTRNILEAAQECGVRALVFTSSCTVVSDDLRHDYPHMDETLPIGNATLVYGQSKTAAERLVLAANSPSFYTCALRPATLFAPGDPILLPTMHALITARTTVFQLGDGFNMYDFVYAPNAADAHVLALDNLLSEGPSNAHWEKEDSGSHGGPTAAGEAFFINNAAPLSFRAFMLGVWAAMGHIPPFTIYVPPWLAWTLAAVTEWWNWASGGRIPEGAVLAGLVGDALRTRYSNGDKASRILGYKPRVPMADAVQISCKGYMERLESKKDVG